MTSEAREMITSIMTRRETEFGRPMTPIEIADGLIAALPEIIKASNWFKSIMESAQRQTLEAAAAYLESQAPFSVEQINNATVMQQLDAIHGVTRSQNCRKDAEAIRNLSLDTKEGE